MSNRTITRDASNQRRTAYDKMDKGDVMEALWDAIKQMKKDGINVGNKADELLAQRQAIRDKFVDA